MKVATIGIDIAKNVFQVYGVCASGEVVVSEQLRRHHLLSFVQQLPPCTFGLAHLMHADASFEGQFLLGTLVRSARAKLGRLVGSMTLSTRWG